MGHLAKSVEIKSSKMELSIPEMIERAIAVAVTRIQDTIHALSLRVTTCKTREKWPYELSALQANIVKLRTM